MAGSLAVEVMTMSVLGRMPSKWLIFRSDRSLQYSSHVFQREVAGFRTRHRMTYKRDCWDNAPAEAFFKKLKPELCGHQAFCGRREALTEVFEYEVCYNRVRLQSRLGYRYPADFETERPRFGISESRCQEKAETSYTAGHGGVFRGTVISVRPRTEALLHPDLGKLS